MLVPVEKIELAKKIYDGRAIEEIVDYFGLDYNEKTKAASCPFHEDKTPSFIWNDKSNCFHCFGEETEVITKKGVFPISEIKNKPVEIINGNGEWESVIFKSYGVQKLLKVTLVSHEKQKTIFATPEHEWIVRDKKYKIKTIDLKPNYRLARMWYHNSKVIVPDMEGMKHGFIYGDGHLIKGKKYTSTARICDKTKFDFCKKIFDISPVCPSIKRELPNCKGVIRYNSNYNPKQIPNPEKHSLEYIYGFLIGYFVADGNCTEHTIQIHNAKRDDLVLIKHLFTLVGIPSYPIGSTIRKKGKDMGIFTLSKDSPLYVLRIVKSEIPENFFQSDKKPTFNYTYKSYLGWKVASVEETDREEEVYCCVTSTHSFVLKDFILTGNCFGCSKNFGIIDLYMEQGLTYLEAVQKLFEKTEIEYSFGEKGIASKPSYVYPKREENNDMTKVIEYWGKRGISEKTLKYADIQADKFGNTVFNYYNDSDVLMNVKYRPSHKIQKGEAKCWFQKGTSFSPILFNMNKCDPSKPLYIQEGEGDCLSVIEAGYTNVVSVPNGSQNMQWIEENWDWLSQFPKIIIWSDNDEPGKKMRKEAIHRLGSWRTYYIEITDHVPDEYAEKYPQLKGKLIKDANELLFYYGKEKVLSYLNNPLELPVENVSDLSKAEDFDINNAEGLYTGIKDLDNQIYKIVFGTVNIVTGKSGEGKSIFVNQIAICQALQQGYDVFVFSGELPTPHLKNWVETNMIGRENITMENGHIRHLNTEARNKMRQWYSGRVMVYDDSYDTTAKALLIKMEEMARKFGTKVFLIDNLMMVDLECSEEGRLQAEKNFIKELIFFAKKFNVLVFLVAHPRKIGGDIRISKEDIAGSSNIVNLAHTVFSVHRYTKQEKEGEEKPNGEYFKGKEPKEYDTVVEVLKNRITGLLPECEMYFDYNSYRFYRTPEELWMRYKWNTDTSPLPTTDPNNHRKEIESPL